MKETKKRETTIDVVISEVYNVERLKDSLEKDEIYVSVIKTSTALEYWLMRLLDHKLDFTSKYKRRLGESRGLFDLIHLSKSLDIIDQEQFSDLESLRSERNNIAHEDKHIEKLEEDKSERNRVKGILKKSIEIIDDLEIK